MTRRGGKNQENPERIEQYAMGQELGRGGFGVVYLALDTMTGQSVAVKRLSLHNMSEEDIETTQGEIELLKKLQHPNIVKYVQSVRTGGYLYIALEYVENGSLTSLIKKFGTFNETLSAVYIFQVLQGLSFLHEQGVIHRDIKGENILTTKEGFVKLADFGVAIQGVDHEHDVVGTPYWMAPEIIEMAGSSSACDIWSVGCTIIEMLTGKPPYFDYNPMTALFRIVQDEYPPFPDHLSPALRDFLMQCFKKEPSFRKTAQELLSHPWIVNTVKSKAKAQQQTEEEVESGNKKIMEIAASAIEGARMSKEKLKDKDNLSNLLGNATADAFGDDDDDDDALLQLQKDIKQGKISVRQSKTDNECSSSYGNSQKHNFHTIGLQDVKEFEKINQNLFENTLKGMVLRKKQDSHVDENGNDDCKPRLFTLDDVTSEDINEWAVKADKNSTTKQTAIPGDLDEFDFSDDEQDAPVSTLLSSGTPGKTLQSLKEAVHRREAFNENDPDSTVPTLSYGEKEIYKPPAYHNSLKSKLVGKKDLQSFADSDEDEDWDVPINSRLHNEPAPNSGGQLAGVFAGKPDIDTAFGNDDEDDVDLNVLSDPEPSKRKGKNGNAPTGEKQKRNGLAQFQETDENLNMDKINADVSDKESSTWSSVPMVSTESLKEKLARKQKGSRLQEAWTEDKQESSGVVMDIDRALEEEGMETEIIPDTEEISLTVKRQNSILSILNRIQGSSDVAPETIKQSCKTLRSLFRESEHLKQFFVKRHGVLPLLELLQFWKSVDKSVVCSLLSTMNHLVHNEPGVHESLALIGVTPVVMAFADPHFSPRIRQEAAVFINQCCHNSRLTLQLFVAAGGANVLVELLRASVKPPGSESFLEQETGIDTTEDSASDITVLDLGDDTRREKGEMDQLLLQQAVKGISTVLDMQAAVMTQNEFRRLFIRTGILEPLVMAMRASFYFVCNSLSNATQKASSQEDFAGESGDISVTSLQFTPDDFRRGAVPKTLLPSSPFLDTRMFQGTSSDSNSTTIEQMNQRRASAESRTLNDAVRGDDSSDEEDDDWKPFGMKDLNFAQKQNEKVAPSSHHSRSRSEQINRSVDPKPKKPLRRSAGDTGPISKAIIESDELPVDDKIRNVLNDMRSLMNLLVMLAQGDSFVKSALGKKDELVRVLLFILRPAPYALLNHHLYTPIVYYCLKTIRHMSMEPSVVEQLSKAGAISTLVPLLREESELDVLSEEESDRHSKEVRHFVLHTLFNLCRVNNVRREAAAMNGIIPPLQKLLEKQNSLQPLALPILCDLAHSGPMTRKILWRHDGVTMYINILKRNYWAMHALNSLSVWLGKEPEKVERALTKQSHVDALVEMFRETPRSYFETIVGHFESMLDRGPLLAKCMSFSHEFIENIIDRLQKKNSAIVRRSLLNMLKLTFLASPEKRTLEKKFNLQPFVQKIRKTASKEGQVLLEQIAEAILAAMEGNEPG